MTQLSIPIEVAPHEITRKQSLGAAIALCAEVAGFDPKQVQSLLKLDKAQWSRWIGNTEGITWGKLEALMDTCGNDAPLLWMLHDRGYDVASLRHYETELEQQNRLLREENAALKRVLKGTA